MTSKKQQNQDAQAYQALVAQSLIEQHEDIGKLDAKLTHNITLATQSVKQVKEIIDAMAKHSESYGQLSHTQELTQTKLTELTQTLNQLIATDNLKSEKSQKLIDTTIALGEELEKQTESISNLISEIHDDTKQQIEGLMDTLTLISLDISKINDKTEFEKLHNRFDEIELMIKDTQEIIKEQDDEYFELLNRHKENEAQLTSTLDELLQTSIETSDSLTVLVSKIDIVSTQLEAMGSASDNSVKSLITK